MKKQYIENLRVFSMISVVLIHVCTCATAYFKVDMSVACMCRSLKDILHFAVPVFFMISGALLLAPEKNITLEKLCKKYLFKYICVIVVFCWGFSLVDYVVKNRAFEFKFVIKSFIDMLQGDWTPLWIHMWYMYALVGAMLMLPVLRAVIEKFNKQYCFYFAIVGLIFLSVIPLLSSVTESKFGISMKFSIYCFYMLLGYWIDTEYIKIKTNFCIACICICILLIVLNDYLHVFWHIHMGLEGYSSPAIVLYSSAIFCLAKQKADKPVPFIGKRIMSFMSVNSFGVYIFHVMWINVIYKIFRFDPFENIWILNMIIVWMAVLIASLFTTAFMRKLPIMKKLL